MTGFNLRRLLQNRVPVLKWLPLYRTNDALGDLVAGLTVGLTLIPQVLSQAPRFYREERKVLVPWLIDRGRGTSGPALFLLPLYFQAIAYAGLAGLTPQYGLYSAFAGSFVYIVFGTCREVNIGPTALISLLTYTYAR